MKSIISLSIIVMLAFVTTATTCTKDEEKEDVKVETNSKPPMRVVKYPNKNEKGLLAAGDISIENVTIDSSIARQAIEESATKIKLNGTYISPFAARLANSGLTQLTTEISALTCAGGCASTLAAVCITYGQSGSTLVPYFQPLLLCISGATFITKGVKKQNYTLCDAGSNYSVTNQGTLTLISGQAPTREMNKNIYLYQTTKTQNPYGVEVMDIEGNFKEFVLSNSALGHARTIIYPIAELQHIAGSMDTVLLWNALESVEVHQSNGDINIVNKHDLIISSKDVKLKNSKLSIPEEAKFANLSNICPPSCKEGSVTIVIQ